MEVSTADLRALLELVKEATARAYWLLDTDERDLVDRLREGLAKEERPSLKASIQAELQRLEDARARVSEGLSRYRETPSQARARPTPAKETGDGSRKG